MKTLPPPIDADLMPVALVQLDAARNIESLNTSAEALLGVSRYAGNGRSFASVLYHDSDLLTLISRAEKTTGRIAAIVDLAGPSLKTVRRVHAVITTAPDGRSALALAPHAVGDATDIDAASLGMFGSILGHEVKNPLAGVSGATQLLMRKAREDQTELLHLILEESDRIVRLVDKLSAFELFSSPKCKPLNVHRVLEQVIKSEALAFEAISFTRNFDPSLPDVMGDSDHLHEAFQNIVRNAAQAVEDIATGARVEIQTRFSLGGHTTQLASGGTLRSVRISITDNGPGIAPADQKRIFEMFQSTKATGSGLGLTIASQVVAAHGGHIELDSQPDQTSFHIFLPVASPS